VRRGVRVISFGVSAGAEVRCEVLWSGGKGSRCRVTCGREGREIKLKVPGVHNVVNAAAAVAAVRAVEPGYSLGYVAEVLGEFEPVWMRCQVERVRGVEVIVDCYNANPESTLAALQVLGRHEGGRRIAVLGEMHELGEAAARCHYEIGEGAARTGVDELIAVGAHGEDVLAGARAAGMEMERLHLARDAAEVVREVARCAREGDCVLIKGSRRAHLEEVLELLRQMPQMTVAE
ncbi:MAG: UDP-N-acetylmuramoyl-tripeptide--D-alanyl-D-alanine ligase, partial [bacterium]|nr:UDP-N-acetylmuramoyl-tripeptide--D-alanyl-D-alanine ligase [bacterium]